MGVQEAPVTITAGDVLLDGDLAVPTEAAGVVVFAHGSGSSRHSPRNREVAAGLRARGLGTLLMDLLTTAEEQVDARTRELRFDVDLLARRLVGATDWLSSREETRRLRIGYFGASTGAAAALIAATHRADAVGAVVSRGGRPDLAGSALEQVRAPTLLIVGGADEQVLALNRQALAAMEADATLEIVPGAGHLFSEPGALEEVSRLAGEFLTRHIGGRTR
jgi:putative phosphoribosyl transferase